jgi:hypothetical protein
VSKLSSSSSSSSSSLPPRPVARPSCRPRPRASTDVDDALARGVVVLLVAEDVRFGDGRPASWFTCCCFVRFCV